MLNANARSLKPKMENCMEELESDVGIVSETWLQDGSLENIVINSGGEHGLSTFTRNRQQVTYNGRQYGGVAVFSRASKTTFKVLDIPNPDDFEVLCITRKIEKIKDREAIIAIYILPNYTKHRAEACLDYIADTVAEAKQRLDSPLIIVGGDWNQWPLKPVTDNHPDLVEVDHGPTRADRKID